jgi:hypothetical protein
MVTPSQIIQNITIFKHIRINKYCFVYLNKSARRIVTPSQIIPKVCYL